MTNIQSGSTDFVIRPEEPGDLAAVTHLSARAFGPGRFARTAYRIREGVPPVLELSLTAWWDGHLAGAIRFTSISIGGAGGALLLGPLAVDPIFSGQGYGRTLVWEGLTRARALDYRLVVLVGDLPYYARFGFVPAPPGQIELPGPVDPARLLARELEPDVLKNFHGLVQATVPSDPRGTR